jgi:uncharacterized membrane protein (UPF0182 family)
LKRVPTPSRPPSEPKTARPKAARRKTAGPETAAPKAAGRRTAKPTTPAGFTQLAAGGAFLKRTARRQGLNKPDRRGALKRWAIRLVLAVVALVVLWQLFLVAVGIITNDMWFDSVQAGSVYHTQLEARTLLFCVFAVVGGVVGGLTTWAVTRIRPKLELSSDYDTFRWSFRKFEPRVRPFIVVLGVVVPAILLGRSAQRGWQTYLLWRHVTPFHQTDPLFHKDISFFMEVYPFHQFVVTLLLRAVTYCLFIAVIAGYWYGTWRLRRGHRKVTNGFTRLVSLLLAAYVALRAVNYWVSRYGLVTSTRGPVTGAGYTDTNASLPSKYVLMAVAIVCALALLANAVLAGRVRLFGRIRVFGRVRLIAATLVVAFVFVQLAGSAWPGLVYHFREQPSASKVDLKEIAQNQKATLAAFGLDGDVSTVGYDGSASANDSATQVQLANTTAQASVIDPNQVSPTFNVKQQLQSYYGFKSTLDTSHYDINGKSQDVALATRELKPSGIPSASWVNQHLVYTHGYGVVAAPTTKVDAKTASPVFLDGGLPPGQQIPVTRPQIYFGQGFNSSSYSIVGQPKGSTTNLEFDHPGSNGSSASVSTTYAGKGGIPIGSALRRLLFAVQMGSPNILFSSELNSASQLLEVLNPAARVAKVAPWLTLDGNVYPAVVDGQVKWIVDGYTTSSNYPYSQLVNLHSATATTLTADGASVAQPRTQVNYMQNSVKAVVDAYTGKVSLYEWNQKQHADPLLKAWESVFPGLVEPQSDISSALLTQMRYPTDLFNVQRTVLAKYHVSGASNFYSGNDFWTVPTDPTVGSSNTINSSTAAGVTNSSRGTASAPQPSRYMSMSATGSGTQQYRLSTPMVTLSGRGLAAFISVNAEPGPDYGKFTVLDFPSSSGGESPSQVQNDIESDTNITKALTLQRGGNSNVVLGDLESIPVDGRILYVEPVYTQSTGGASFPILRHVIALYGTGQPSFENKLSAAIRVAIQSAGT